MMIISYFFLEKYVGKVQAKLDYVSIIHTGIYSALVLDEWHCRNANPRKKLMSLLPKESQSSSSATCASLCSLGIFSFGYVFVIC